MASNAIYLEEQVCEMQKCLEIYRLAIDTLKRQNELLKQEMETKNNEWLEKQNNWCVVDKHNMKMVSTLSEMLKKSNVEQMKKSLDEHIKKNKSLKKKIKCLKNYIDTTNDAMHDIICDGDKLIDNIN
ncbi:Maph37 [Matsumuraeses phaseoli granulovirus]|uniref:Maph37 n=1 Tax=Matsumuraeses phaseoli granulovirus TaxID=2760664 RepID=A0AAE7SY47_9BBAC|nr:Maph37 [Matsumuraeses phaseoli granulovirus]QOD40000.1 Maph37 [Matsumuraeses phaseoli granulovirus]